jgi:hypothetical protein
MPQDSGLLRNAMDKFYTKEFIAQTCVNRVEVFANIDSNDLIIEPSAGNGSFLNSIKLLSSHTLFIDIDPENTEVKKQDYLTLDIDPLASIHKNIHVIGNPPFGRQSSLAIKFIKKSCEFCQSISFILPKSFRKDSMKSYFPLNFHLEDEMDLPDHAFSIDGDTHHVPCVFQIWVRKEKQREKIIKQVASGFKFVKKIEPHDIALRRVGVYAGRIDNVTEDKNIQTHYFIKFLNSASLEENMLDLKKVEFTHDNTVGPKSISKPEVIREFNKVINPN